MRRKKNYFVTEAGGPEPIAVCVRRLVSFSEVDAMAIAWHGRYPQFFEAASEELCRRIGLTYEQYFVHGLRAPIVQMHVDYFRSVTLAEEIAIQARLVWTQAARLNTEYRIDKQDGSVAATGYTVQMFTDGATGEPILVVPALYAQVREKWIKGDFACLTVTP